MSSSARIGALARRCAAYSVAAGGAHCAPFDGYALCGDPQQTWPRWRGTQRGGCCASGFICVQSALITLPASSALFLLGGLALLLQRIGWRR